MQKDLSSYLSILKERPLSQKEAKESIELLLKGEATPAQTGAFLFAVGARPIGIEEWLGFVQGLKKHWKHRSALVPSILILPLPHRITDTWLAGWKVLKEGIDLTIQVQTNQQLEATQHQVTYLLPASSPARKKVKLYSLESRFPALTPLLRLEAELGISSWLSMVACLVAAPRAGSCLLSLPPEVWWEPVLHALRKEGVQQGILLQQTAASSSRYRVVHFHRIAVSLNFVTEQLFSTAETLVNSEWESTPFMHLQTILLLLLGQKISSIREGIEQFRRPRCNEKKPDHFS